MSCFVSICEAKNASALVLESSKERERMTAVRSQCHAQVFFSAHPRHSRNTPLQNWRLCLRLLGLGGSILHVVFYTTWDLRNMRLLQGSERTQPKAAARYDAYPMACNEKDLFSENISRHVALSCLSYTSPKRLPTHCQPHLGLETFSQ